MRLSLCCVWIFTLHAVAQHPPDRGEGGVQPGWKRQRTGAPTPLRPDASKPAAVRGAGEKLGGGGGAAVNGPHVCGGRCCAGWTVSPRTRRCTKPRCLPRCHNGALCRQSNRCVCRRGFHGYRCALSTRTSVHQTRKMRVLSARSGPAAILTPATIITSRPEPGASDLNPPETPQDFGPDKSGVKTEDGGVSKRFVMPEENQASLKRPHTGQRAESQTRDTEEDGLAGFKPGESPNLKSGSEPEDRQESHRKVSLDLKETWKQSDSETKMVSKTPNLEGRSKVELNPGSGKDYGLHPESSPGVDDGVTGEKKKKQEVKNGGTKKQSLSLREARAVLLRKTLSRGGRGDKMATLLMKHIEKERKKVLTVTSSSNSSSLSSPSSVKTSVKTFYTQRGQYTVHVTAPAVLCPLLCKNGGVCLQKDRCLCPPNFTGKFCQIPLATAAAAASPPATSTSTNEIVKPALLSAVAANQELTQSEFLLPLGQNQEMGRSGAPGPSMVKVRVQHPPEASVKIHQVLKVSGFSPTLRTLSSSSSGSAGAPAPAGVGVQAQTVRGDGIFTQQAGFKYCFREVKDGQCSSPLPGLRSRETCCRGIGKAWGISDCVLCPDSTAGQSNSSCPAGYERANGTQCVDVNECLQPGLCENGICVNTRGSYSCVCRAGFILDASHGICISQSVISEEKGQCHRVLGSGQGPSSCSLPILRNITKQICCCSRVGKAWGPACQRCPYFGSVAFKEICPAGPGYHYSASALQFNQRVTEQLGSRGAPLVTHGHQNNQNNQGSGSGSSSSGASRSHEKPSSSGATAGGGSTLLSSASGVGSTSTSSTHDRPSPPHPRPQPQPQPQLRPHPQPQPQPQPQPGPADSPSSRPVQPGSTGTTATQDKAQTPGRPGTQQNRPNLSPSFTTQPRPQPPPNGSEAGGRSSSVSRPDQPAARGDSLPAPARPHTPERGSRPSGELPPLSPAARPTTRPVRVQTVRGVCESRPGVCGRGRCVDQPGGKHTCVCDQGYQPNSQRTYCQDVNECVESPGVCALGECVNTIGSYKCVCPSGYRSSSQQTSCQDIDECLQSPCSNGRCDNMPGSYRCVCRLGYRLSGNTCTDVDECDDALQCPGQECINSQGSYRCVSCRPGFRLLNRLCTDIDECRQARCSNGRCENTAGSYRCVCRHGYKLQNNTCTDVDECAEPSQCPGQMCVNTVGSYRCVSCRLGYTLTNRQCADVNECEDSESCPGQQCVNTEGSYSCVDCQQGYHSVNGLCADVDECVQGSPCPGQQCVNTVGSYRCVSCQPGYSSKDGSCQDVDECVQGSPCPGQQCVNTVGSYRCVSCQPGYSSKDGSCQDVDECVQGSPCPGQQCVNTVGSYRCVSCQPGYSSKDGSCQDVDECVQGSPCPGQQCVNTVGSYRCVSCQPGYSSKDGSCQDVDECASAGTCEAERVCVNTVGSFRCDCPPGYRTSGLGRQCRDINECLEGDFCFPRGECVNSPGSYTCVCSQGFTLSDNRTACIDVDECVKSGVCLDGRCVNTEGSFQCQCQTGFTTNPERTACLDVDECVSSGGSVCVSQRCENTIGSYRCLTSCEPGYQVTQTGSCVDVNECANKTVCGDHAFCQNLIGNYLCVCDQGFTSTADGNTCVDEDECVSLPGVCGSARCENVEGSFMCECDRRGDEFDTASRKCVNTAQQGTVPGYPSTSSSSSSSSSFHVSMVELAPVLPPLPAARPGELRECYYNLAERGTCSLLATNTSQQECCCTVGEGWGLGCQYHACPPAHTADFLSLCPSGRGYVTTGPGAFSYRDVDECKRFHPEVCKNGVCVNNIPGYNCYCSSGYVYNSTLLECVDHDECEEESCVGGVCVNTVGSYYCSCQPPLVLDDTQRNCVNSSHLTVDENLSLCWQHVTADLVCQSPLLGAQVTFTDCCCLYGEGWGMECALCPSTDSEEYATLCSSFTPSRFPESFQDSGPGAGRGRGGVAPPYFPPYSPDSFPPAVLSDYDDYSPAGGSRSGFIGRTPATFHLPDGAYRRPEYSTGYYSEGDFAPPDVSPPRTPSYRLPPDPRGERAFGVRLAPPSRPDGPALSLAPLPGAPYEVEQQEEEEEAAWRPGPPFPPFTERSRGGGGAPRVYERRYESYAGLSAAEDCGILHGCENGRCIRVAEGYTCDCYQGYELDMTSMTCIDVNECEDGVGVDFPCVNARCVNTDGSFRCVCRRGYVMSRRPNHCVAA